MQSAKLSSNNDQVTMKKDLRSPENTPGMTEEGTKEEVVKELINLHIDADFN